MLVKMQKKIVLSYTSFIKELVNLIPLLIQNIIYTFPNDKTFVKNVYRYQRGNQKPFLNRKTKQYNGQRKITKRQTMIH
jgi:hypothetical protein